MEPAEGDMETQQLTLSTSMSDNNTEQQAGQLEAAMEKSSQPSSEFEDASYDETRYAAAAATGNITASRHSVTFLRKHPCRQSLSHRSLTFFEAVKVIVTSYARIQVA
jgi:hypothetical protein